MPTIIRFFALIAFCTTAVAADDAVVVTTLRNPVAKSYRKMVEAAKLFEEKRHLAPEAALRFKLLPRERGRHDGRHPPQGGSREPRDSAEGVARPDLRAGSGSASAQGGRARRSEPQGRNHDLARGRAHARPAAGYAPAGRPAPGVRGRHEGRPDLEISARDSGTGSMRCCPRGRRTATARSRTTSSSPSARCSASRWSTARAAKCCRSTGCTRARRRDPDWKKHLAALRLRGAARSRLLHAARRSQLVRRDARRAGIHGRRHVKAARRRLRVARRVRSGAATAESGGTPPLGAGRDSLRARRRARARHRQEHQGRCARGARRSDRGRLRERLRSLGVPRARAGERAGCESRARPPVRAVRNTRPGRACAEARFRLTCRRPNRRRHRRHRPTPTRPNPARASARRCSSPTCRPIRRSRSSCCCPRTSRCVPPVPAGRSQAERVAASARAKARERVRFMRELLSKAPADATNAPLPSL